MTFQENKSPNIEVEKSHQALMIDLTGLAAGSSTQALIALVDLDAGLAAGSSTQALIALVVHVAVQKRNAKQPKLVQVLGYTFG